MNELKRIYGAKTILLFILLVIINFLLFMLSCDENKSITADGEELSEYIASYGGFIDSISEKSGNMSLFDIYGGGFSAKNIKKTAEDFKGLSDISLVYGDNRGTVIFSDYHLTDIFLFGFLIIVSAGFLTERKNGLFLIVRSTAYGRIRLYFSRCFVLLFSAFICAVFLYGGNIAGAFISFGGIDLSAPIQSVPEFMMCPFGISVGEYFIALIGIKILASFAAAMIFFTLASLFGSGAAYVISGAIAVPELLAYFLIPTVSELGPLKFINIITAIRSDDLFRIYCNLNAFGEPVGTLPAVIFITSAVTAILFFAGIFIHGKIYVKKENGNFPIIIKIKKFAERHAVPHSLFYWESYKLFIMRRGIMIIIAVMAAALSQALKYDYFYPVDPYALPWYVKYDGEISEEMLSDMEHEESRLNDSIERLTKTIDKMLENESSDPNALGKLMESREQLRSELNALIPIVENVRDGVGYSLRTGRKIQLIKPYSYDMLIKRDVRTIRRNSIFILIGIIFSLSGVYSFEKQSNMELTLRSSYRGRLSVNICKLAAIILLCSFMAVFVHMLQFCIIAKDMGLNNIDAPVQSLQFMRGYEPYITIRQYFILLFTMRAAMACIAGLSCAAISRLCSDTASSAGASAFAAIAFSLAPQMIFGESTVGLIGLIGGEFMM